VQSALRLGLPLLRLLLNNAVLYLLGLGSIKLSARLARIRFHVRLKDDE
jgi:hypothetical protein